MAPSLAFGMTDEEFGIRVAKTISIIDFLRDAGYSDHGSQYGVFRRRVQRLGIDTSHFTNASIGPRRVLADYLVCGGPEIRSNKLKAMLMAAGLKSAECENCHRTEWQGYPIPLDLEHKNGNNRDNRIENLVILCANCHRLTPTHSRAKRRRPKKEHVCDGCGGPRYRQAKLCNKCADRSSKPHIVWPSSEEIIRRVTNSTWRTVASELGVSDNAVRKHLRDRGVDLDIVLSAEQRRQRKLAPVYPLASNQVKG